jgi:hypothetical protein
MRIHLQEEGMFTEKKFVEDDICITTWAETITEEMELECFCAHLVA